MSLTAERREAEGSPSCRTARYYRGVSPPVPNGTFGRGLRVAPLNTTKAGLVYVIGAQRSAVEGSYHTNSEIKYKYEYKNSADTVLCFLSIISGKNPGGRLIEIQKYVYNQQGKIILHANCYQNTNHISARLTRFYYDSLNKMTAKHFYYAHDFSKTLDEHYPTNAAAYELNSAENYFYDNKGRMISVKQMTGPKDERFTESLQYDERGRVKTIARFQKYGAMGELRLMNIHQRTKYVYTDSSWTKYELAFSGDKVEKDEAGQYHPIIEKVFTPGGLINKEYLGGGKDKTLYRQYAYVYFE